MRAVRWLLFATFLAVAGAALAANNPKQLHNVTKKLSDAMAQLRAVKRDERATTRALSDLDSARFRTQRALRRLDKELQAQTLKVGDLQGQVQVDETALAKLQAQLRRRLRALAQVGQLGPLRILLGSDSLDQFALRRVLLRRIAAHDALLLRQLKQGQYRLSADQQALVDALELLKQQRDETREALSQLEQSREERAEAVLKLGAKRGTLELQIEVLRESEKKLRHEIWRHAKPKGEAVGLAKLRGQIPWPVLGPVEPGKGGGWNLRAAKGQVVHAVAAGTVVHAGFLRAYGVLVIIDHGHGFHSLCAHLDQLNVKTGQAVPAGANLGSVGESESLDGPKLYFELRRGGRPVSLKNWLSRKARLP